MEKDSDEVSLAEEEIIRRYCFLYENSFFILMQILFEHQHDLKDVCKDIENITGLSLFNQIPYDRNEKFSNHISMFHLVEEYMLGDYRFRKTELERIVNDMRYRPSVYLKAKMDYIFTDKKYGINKKDISMQVLLELMGDFIKSQNGYTAIIERGRHRIIYKGGSGKVLLNVADKKNKAKGLDVFFDICKYKNDSNSKKYERIISNHQMSDLSNRSLVMYNEFLFALRRISFADKNKVVQDIYLEYHDELPYDLESVCEEKKDNIERVVLQSCGNRFYINEDRIFYYKDNYLHLCPKCGYVVNVGKKIFSDGVKKRIEDRCFDDKNILYKQNKLSELISLGGLTTVKSLIKSRSISK